MASTSEYEQQRSWQDQHRQKPCYTPGDRSQMAMDAANYFAQQEREYWFFRDKMRENILASQITIIK